MDQEIVQELAAKLASHPSLSDENDCSKFTELAYLYHFVQCYRPSMQIADRQRHPVYVIEDAGCRIGIAFCDLQLPSYLYSGQETEVMYEPEGAEFSDITALWLVLVARGVKQHDPFFNELIIQHNLSSTFDKIFLFDFFQSDIQIIK
ncbi:hypothetical protein KXD93_14450 [Mucilaginibacter sp. BJC16-A38]|uniref:hypothetical protein n=1 Tax=Mucilaginibacter phenanthrenivorans TaxID=1234842 RepID=UPI0021580405|nr:hypothetical protein [Mucilaginibacter phenanthrenivorans]MCR8558855.1 hypothetical protein [Mucilaginibacter phenanthrenivorans]